MLVNLVVNQSKLERSHCSSIWSVVPFCKIVFTTWILCFPFINLPTSAAWHINLGQYICQVSLTAHDYNIGKVIPSKPSQPTSSTSQHLLLQYCLNNCQSTVRAYSAPKDQYRQLATIGLIYIHGRLSLNVFSFKFNNSRSDRVDCGFNQDMM